MLSLLTLLTAGLTVVVLMFLHEGAHYLSAKTMDLRVIGYGFKTERRVPYPYVEVSWTPDARKRRIYLMAGVASTASLFGLLLLFTGLTPLTGIYLGFAAQLILETNPVFSDFIILRRMAAGNGKPGGDDADANSHLFTPEWYLHFTLWIGLVIVLLSPRFLLGVVMP